VMRLNQSMSYINSQPWECDEMTLPLSSYGALAGGDQSWKEARQKLKLHSVVDLQS